MGSAWKGYCTVASIGEGCWGVENGGAADSMDSTRGGGLGGSEVLTRDSSMEDATFGGSGTISCGREIDSGSTADSGICRGGECDPSCVAAGSGKFCGGVCVVSGSCSLCGGGVEFSGSRGCRVGGGKAESCSGWSEGSVPSCGAGGLDSIVGAGKPGKCVASPSSSSSSIGVSIINVGSRFVSPCSEAALGASKAISDLISGSVMGSFTFSMATSRITSMPCSTVLSVVVPIEVVACPSSSTSMTSGVASSSMTSSPGFGSNGGTCVCCTCSVGSGSIPALESI